MSEKIKAKIGEEKYNLFLKDSGLKPEDFDLVNDGSYVPRTRLNEINGKLKATEEKVSSYEKQLNDTKKMLEGSEEFKNKYEELNTKYENDIALKDKEILNTSKQFLVESKLREVGAKHTSLLIKEIDLEKLTIDNNNLLGMDEVIKNLKTNYEDLFITKNASNNTTQNTNNSETNNSNSSEIDWEAELKDI